MLFEVVKLVFLDLLQRGHHFVLLFAYLQGPLPERDFERDVDHLLREEAKVHELLGEHAHIFRRRDFEVQPIELVLTGELGRRVDRVGAVGANFDVLEGAFFLATDFDVWG